MDEIWKDVVGYEGLYKISNLGRVLYLKRNNPNVKVKNYNRILNPFLNHDGYYTVNLLKDGKGKTGYIARLVAEAFIPNPNDLLEVNHKNLIKTNNFSNNLEWVTRQENMDHFYKYGKRKTRKNGSPQKLNKEDVKNIRNNYFELKISQKEISKNYKINQATISDIINNKIWNYPECDPRSPEEIYDMSKYRRSKLTQKDVREILYLASIRNQNTFTFKELAKKFNVSENHIYQIVNGNTWKSIKITCL